ncbi:hypothetical protein EMPG_13169, partial [Blastomyces silverae]
RGVVPAILFGLQSSVRSVCKSPGQCSAYGTSDVEVPDEKHTRYLGRQETG